MSDTQPKSKAKWILILIGLLFAGMLIFGFQSVNRGRPEIGEPAPEISLEFYEGYEWNGQSTAMLSDLQGDVVVLNFWASWCGPCHLEAPELEAVSKEYADKGVTFIGVAWTDTERGANEFMAEYGISYPNAPDIQQRAKEVYKFNGVPETYIIGRDGIITHFYAQPLNAEQLSIVIDEALN